MEDMLADNMEGIVYGSMEDIWTEGIMDMSGDTIEGWTIYNGLKYAASIRDPHKGVIFQKMRSSSQYICSRAHILYCYISFCTLLIQKRRYAFCY